MSTKDIAIPDIGDFDEVPVVEIHVAVGDQVDEEQPLITLESDKATMEVPAPSAGTIQEVLVAEGDKVKQGVVIVRMATSAGDNSTPPTPPTPAPSSVPQTQPPPASSVSTSLPSNGVAKVGDIHAQVLVLGAGPGGYTAAFRAADLGLNTVLVERDPRLGGVCLNVGCIPSKALLHAAKIITEAEESAELGLKFGPPEIDLGALRGWKDSVVERLTGGLSGLANSRKVKVLHGVGSFVDPHVLSVTDDNGKVTTVSFDNGIIAAGSEPVSLPFFPSDDERVINSSGALELKDIPKRLLIVGGGIIGLEMGCVYDALGSEVSIVELLDGLMPGADRDLVRPLQKRLQKRLKSIKLKTKVVGCESKPSGLTITFENTKGEQTSEEYDRVLVAVGRKPNGRLIGLDNTGVEVDERGFVPVDRQMRTNVPHIFAIGDIVGQPMLAHKATHEGKTAAEVIAGQPSSFDARVIPSVAYTDPEVAWTGLTETEAKQKGIAYEKGSFPWAASGRSLAMARDEGLTKVLFDPQTHQVLGGGIVGSQAGDLIAELCLAIEMGADAADLGLTIHPHPTLSESVAMSAEAFEGTITDLYIPKKDKARRQN